MNGTQTKKTTKNGKIVVDSIYNTPEEAYLVKMLAQNKNEGAKNLRAMKNIELKADRITSVIFVYLPNFFE